MGVRGDSSGDGDGRMRLAVMSHPVADPGHRLARILIPAHPLRNTLVHPPTHHLAELRASRADLLRLGALFRVSATSPHSLVHIPVPRSARHLTNWEGLRPTALVIGREDAGLRVSDWPSLRRRMQHGPASGHRTEVVAPAPRTTADRWSAMHRLAEAHPARMTEHAGTVVMLGRAELLFWIGDMVTEAGHALASSRHIHRHGEALLADLWGLVMDTRSPGGYRRGVEFAVTGVDPIFHRSRWQEAAARRKPGPSSRSRHRRDPLPSETPMA